MTLPTDLLAQVQSLRTNWHNFGPAGPALVTLVEQIDTGIVENALEYDEDSLLDGLLTPLFLFPLNVFGVSRAELQAHLKRGLQLLEVSAGASSVEPVESTFTAGDIEDLSALWDNLGPAGDDLRALCYKIAAWTNGEINWTSEELVGVLVDLLDTMLGTAISLDTDDLREFIHTAVEDLITVAGGDPEVVEPPTPPGPVTIGDEATTPQGTSFEGSWNSPPSGGTAQPMTVLPTTDADFDSTTNPPVIGPYVYALHNPGTAPVNWSILEGYPDWITLSQTSGTLAAHQTVLVSVSPKASAILELESGTYTGSIVFFDHSNRQSHSRDCELVWATAPGSAVFTLSPVEGFAIVGVQGDADSFTPTAKAYGITNIGDAAGDWSVTLDPAWLEVADGFPSSGTLQPGASAIVRLTYDPATPAALDAGLVDGSITFTNEENDDAVELDFYCTVFEDDDQEPQPGIDPGQGGPAALIIDPTDIMPGGVLPADAVVGYAGPFYDIYTPDQLKPYPTIEIDYDAFTGTQILIEWVTSSSKYRVTVNGEVKYDGINTSFVPGISAATWTYFSTPNRIIGFCYRTFGTGDFTKIRLGWGESGQGAYGALGLGSVSAVSNGVDCALYNPATGAPVKNLIIEAATLSGDRPRIRALSGGTANGGYDGVVLRYIEFGPDDAAAGQNLISNNINNWNGLLVFKDCYFKPKVWTPGTDNGWDQEFQGQKWTVNMYSVGGLVFDGCKFGDSDTGRLVSEHWIYVKNVRNFMFVQGCDFAVSGRTSIQVVNRANESSVLGPNGGSGYGPIVVVGNTSDGNRWKDNAAGGHMITFAGHLGPCFVDDWTLNPLPSALDDLSPGYFNRLGGGILGWHGGGNAGPTTIDGQPLPPQAGAFVFHDPDGYAVTSLWIGKVDIDLDEGQDQPRSALQTQSVRDLYVYVGADQVLKSTATKTWFELDHSSAGTGDASVGLQTHYLGHEFQLQVESERIFWFDTYEADTTAMAVTSVEPTCVFDDVMAGTTVKQPSGEGLNGTTITEMDWAYSKA